MSGSTSLPTIMLMGCTNKTITYRAGGNEGVCLQSPQHGVQQLANFDVAKGDFIGMNDVLELTLAHNNLSDVGNWVTSSVSAGGTTLYFDPTGQGLVGSPFAFLQGVSTTVAALVADGGMLYAPDPITVAAPFNAPFTFRSGGLETLVLRAPPPGIATAQINGFDPTHSDILDVSAVLNRTTAAPDLSNVGNYITATQSGGNTVLSIDTTGTGQAGTAFAVLNGVNVTVNQLMADNALIFKPTAATVGATPAATFIFRPEGNESVLPAAVTTHSGPITLENFSSSQGDSIDFKAIYAEFQMQGDISHIAAYVSATQSGGSTTLWFDKTGSGHGGGLAVAVLDHTLISIPQLLSAHALNLN